MEFGDLAIRTYLSDSDEVRKTREAYGISDSELRFVMELIIDFDHARAFASIFPIEPEITSGSDIKSMALGLASRPEILRAISSEMNIQGAALSIKKNLIMAGIFKEAINPKAKPTERLKAYELLARMIGDLEPQDLGKHPAISVNIVDNRAVQLQHDTIKVNVPVVTTNPLHESNRIVEHEVEQPSQDQSIYPEIDGIIPEEDEAPPDDER